MVSREKWGEVIRDFQENLLPRLIEREINIPLDVPINRAISIIGPRRAGKTYVMYQTIGKIIKINEKQQILYVNLERADLGLLNEQDLINLLEVFFEIYPQNWNKKVWLFLDEIQVVQNWEKFVRTALDKNIKVFISGSSSKLLSKEIASSMRGRTITFTVLPFSFKEYLKAENLKVEKYLSANEKAKILNALNSFLEQGGYPETIFYKKEREKILTEIKDTVIFKDVIERHKIRNIKALKILIDALINSKEFSIHKFYNYLKSLGLKVGKNAIYNYVDYLNDAFFVFPLKKFSYSYKEAEQSIPKIYLIDNGLLAINGIRNKSKFAENIVFIELLRKNLAVFYWKTRQGKEKEVDFVIVKGQKAKQLIQVSLDIQNYETKERETSALITASKELKCNNLLVITNDYMGEEKIKNKKIKYIPLWKWLLESG